MFLRHCYYSGAITKVRREVLSFFRYGGSRRVPGSLDSTQWSVVRGRKPRSRPLLNHLLLTPSVTRS